MNRKCPMNYIKPSRTEKLIQFGEGGFLRGFVDWMLQVLNEQADFDGSAVVVQPIERGLCDVLSAQDCVYTHIMRGLKGGVPTVEEKLIDSISRTLNPYQDYEAYLRLADAPDFRFVVSNTTEAGIVYAEQPKPEGKVPASFPAKVTDLLFRRYSNGLGGFIFLPCELIENNGATLKACILRHADSWELGDGFKRWVEEENGFCNTLEVGS